MSWHVSTINKSNFNAYSHNLKTFQHWPHSLPTMWGWWMTFVMGLLKFPLHFKRVPKNIIQMEMMNDDNDMSMMNVDANVDDLKYYVGTSDILES
jgi:hypothetical protein